VVLDSVVDGGGGEEGVEAAAAGGGIVLVQDGRDHLALVRGLARPGSLLALGAEAVHMEAKDVPVLDGVGDGVLVQLALEGVGGGSVRGRVAGALHLRGVLVEDGRTGEAEELGAGKELANGLVVLAELGAVALIEDEDEALGA
jgi:hypothetical protein